ncbi:sensor histidine kinase [Paenibacillus sp. NPDC058071]|uniref:sensor histidine kinase n=1 Tax=Paenibacillus sp. NPDC058071 TaxID=3346326 RepID=UPI0036DE8704
MTIRLRLTLWYSSLLGTTLLAFCFAIYFFVNMNTYGELKATMREQAENLRFVGSNDSYNLQRVDRFYEEDLYVQVVNYKEGFIALAPNMKQYGIQFSYPEESGKPHLGFHKTKVAMSGGQFSFLIYQTPLTQKNADGQLTSVGLIQVGAFIGAQERYLNGLRSILFTSSAAALIVAFTFGLFLARQALQPIERVIRSTEKIQSGSDLSVRIPMEGPTDEVGRLIHTLNIMLSRLESAYNGLDESYKAQRRFVSDASHELRTPLTTIRGNIELLEKMWSQPQNGSRAAGGIVAAADAANGIVVKLDAQRWEMTNEAMQDISDEARRMSTLVNDLLALARADAGYVMEKQPLGIQALVEEVTRRAQLLPRTAEWRIGDLSALEGVKVNGSHDYLQQLLFIFIENAFKYTEQGHIELSAKRKDDQIGIVVTDTGIGMDPKEVPHIFDRFYRADESRGQKVGTGLGLSIAQWIIDEHRGSVEVWTRPGDGSVFTIWLPIDFSERQDSTIIEVTDRDEA